MNHRSLPLLIAAGLVSWACSDSVAEESIAQRAENAAPWVEFFAGDSLDGWTQRGGEALFRVEGGEVIGTTVAGTPNSFLASDATYGDFRFEFEFNVDPEINSGVQVRSESRDDYHDGRVHGYQVEIDPSERAWTAGIYDEARRGWLFPLSLNPEAKQAFQQGAWNQVVVEARGPVIRTWLNGTPASYLVDDMTPRGFIALQVHSVSDDLAGRTVRWRNLRLQELGLAGVDRLSSDGFPYVANSMTNTLDPHEQALGWRLLWDGETTTGWRGAHMESFPAQGWRIEDGLLTVLESGGGEAAHGGDIVTVEEFSAFELQLDFRLSEGANSGIKYFVTEQYGNTRGSAIGVEYQLLDDQRHPDAKLGRDGNRTLSSLYDLIAAEKQPRFVKPPGEWNHARLVVRPDRSVEHWLNHQLVLSYVLGSEAFARLVAISKYRNWEGFGDWESGHLLLQDHGNEVSFGNIKLRDLAANG